MDEVNNTIELQGFRIQGYHRIQYCAATFTVFKRQVREPCGPYNGSQTERTRYRQLSEDFVSFAKLSNDHPATSPGHCLSRKIG